MLFNSLWDLSGWISRSHAWWGFTLFSLLPFGLRRMTLVCLFEKKKPLNLFGGMSTILEQIDWNCFGQYPVISCTLKQAKLGSFLRPPSHHVTSWAPTLILWLYSNCQYKHSQQICWSTYSIYSLSDYLCVRYRHVSIWRWEWAWADVKGMQWRVLSIISIAAEGYLYQRRVLVSE